MKKLIIFMLMCLPIVAVAQRIDKPGEPYEVYCVLYTGLFTKISMCNEEYYLVNEKEKDLKFKSYADAITMLTKRGWIYVDMIDSGTFLLKKVVTSDEQAKENLDLRDIRKKKIN